MDLRAPAEIRREDEPFHVRGCVGVGVRPFDENGGPSIADHGALPGPDGPDEQLAGPLPVIGKKVASARGRPQMIELVAL